jgi:hypothetical protein
MHHAMVILFCICSIIMPLCSRRPVNVVRMVSAVCQKLQNMNVSISTVEETAENGESIKLKISAYTCAHCNLFVRSEEECVPVQKSAEVI